MFCFLVIRKFLFTVSLTFYRPVTAKAYHMFHFMTHLVNHHEILGNFLPFSFNIVFIGLMFFTCNTGPNAVEFIINHAEVSIAFVQENKIPSVSSCSDHL